MTRGHQKYFWGKRGRSTCGLGYTVCVRCGKVLLHNAASQRDWNAGCSWDGDR